MKAKPIVIYGKAYRSMKDMPPDIREKYELAMCLLGDAEAGCFPDVGPGDPQAERAGRDAPEEMTNSTNQTANVSTAFDEDLDSLEASDDEPVPFDTDINSDASNTWVLALAGTLLCLGGLAGAWYVFLR